MRVMPMFSQRRAPLVTSPNSATPTSRINPKRYAGNAMRMRWFGGTFAASHMTANATPMLTN